MILVTGGTGLLGSHLLFELVREHEEVVALKRPSSNLEEVKRVFAYHSNEAEELFKLIDWVDVDLLSQFELERVMIDIEQVYHCAGMVSFQPRDRKRMIDFNEQSTANVVNACMEAGVEKLMHVSSSSAIGKAPGGTAADENRIWARSKYSSGYAESKFRSEMEVWRGIEEGLKAVIVNPTIILGPGFWDRGSSSMFSRVAGGLKHATPGVTGYVGVQDVVSAMIQLMSSDIVGERFILSAGDHSYREIFEMMGTSLGVARKLKEVSPSTLGLLVRLDAFTGFFSGKRRITSEHVHSAFYQARFSNEKIREALGMEFTPVSEAIEGVARMYRRDFPLKK
ncbi:MAG: NAD-dependent epimerase/dehydratase family protein [Bacteroidota bacterium]